MSSERESQHVAERQIPKGYQSIAVVPGLGSIASRFLFENDVRNLADLARLDPYDDRFTKLGEDFPRWVLHARNIIADEIIQSVEVRNDAIIVLTSKTYDKQATLKSVLGRLGVYYIYVDTEVREKGDEYEIAIRLKPEQYGSAQAQWNEYKANASLLQELIKKKPIAIRWKSLKEFDSDISRSFSTTKEMLMLARLFLRAEVADGFNLLLIWRESSVNRAASMLLVRNIIPRIRHIELGGCDLAELNDSISLCKEGYLLVVDGWERANGNERRMLLDAMASPKIYEGKGRMARRGGIIVNCWFSTLEKFEPDMLGLFDLAYLLPERHDEYKIIQIPEMLRIEDKELQSVERLIISARNKEVTRPPLIKDVDIRFRKTGLLKKLTFDISRTMIILAEAEARIDNRSSIAEIDIREASNLINEALSSLQAEGRKRRD